MAITVRKSLDSVVWALVAAHNLKQDDGSITDGYHRDLSQVTTGDPSDPASITLTTLQVTAATASSLPTSITLTNNIIGVLSTHMADAHAHLLADATNNPTVDGYIAAIDLTTVKTNLNACKALFNAHLTQTNVHPNNDTANSVSTANATDQTTANNLANALKTAINAHISAGKSGGHDSPRINLIGA